MANTGFKGIDVRQTGNELLFRAFLQTSAGALLGTGTTTVSLMELQSDGTVKSYDFSDNTFKTTALTTATLALTHRPSNNAGTTTGYWTAALSTLTGFTIGGIYVAIVNNTGASPTDQMREFQYGGAEGDLLVTAGSTGQAYLQNDTTKWLAGTIPAVNTTGVPKVDLILGAGATIPAGAIPNAVAGATGGLVIAGSNAATTFSGLTTGALSCTTITASGAVAFQSTFAVTTSTSLAALSCTTLTASGAVAFQSTFTVTGAVGFSSTFATTGTTTFNALTVTNATTLSGAVSLGSTLGVTGTTTLAAVNTVAIGTGNVTITGALSTSGTVTFNAFTITNALTVSGTTTLTGAVAAANASNNIVGVSLLAGSFVTATFGTCDFTGTMKTSIQTAADAAITANTTIIEINADVDEIAALQTTANTINVNVLALGSPMQAGATVVLTDGSLTTAKLGAFALAKTTNITGFNDVSSSDVQTAADTAITANVTIIEIGADVDEIVAFGAPPSAAAIEGLGTPPLGTLENQQTIINAITALGKPLIPAMSNTQGVTNVGATKLFVRRGEIAPVPQLTLVDQQGLLLDLQKATVRFQLVNRETGDIAVDAPAEKLQNDIVPSTFGQCIYYWQPGDTDVPGLYFGYFVVDLGTGPEKFPNTDSFLILIQDK